MLWDVNYDVRRSSYISWIPILLTFCLWNVIEYFPNANFGDASHRDASIWYMTLRNVYAYKRDGGGGNLFLLKCQTFTCIGLELCKMYSLRLFHFCHQVRFTKVTEREIWIASTLKVYKNKGGRCVGLTTLPPSCGDCLEILAASNFWIPDDLPEDSFRRFYAS